MKTYPILDKEEKLHAFEIANSKLGRRNATKVAMSIPNSILVREPKRFLSWFREEIFCEFEISGVLFQIDEPYGDNSRYWIGRKEEGGWCKELELVHKEFQQA